MSVLDRLGVELPDPRRKLRQLTFPLTAPTTPRGVEPLPVEKKTGADYDTEWARTFRARWARTVLLEAVLRPTAAVVARPERKGLDRLEDLRQGERAQPVIFCANHHSHVDTPVVLTSLPEPWRYQVFVGAAADYFFRTRVTGAAAALLLNAIPIERATVTRRSADLAAQLIGEGWSMLIFPEGGRSPDGWGQDFRGGAAYLARRTGAPVVPIHLAGTDRILPKGAKKLKPGPTTVTFGDPLRAEEGEDTRRLAARIEAAVAALADEHTSDWYQARTRAHAGKTPGLGGPEVASWRRAWALGDRAQRKRRKPAWPPR
ncbi:MAG TPA: lysophospholipid acyltransferase family protein [Acidimicrobiales bacterium]|nr:lysophospholipid acyltransferase family protein [Acidimicrobiales bacterium]